MATLQDSEHKQQMSHQNCLHIRERAAPVGRHKPLFKVPVLMSYWFMWPVSAAWRRRWQLHKTTNRSAKLCAQLSALSALQTTRRFHFILVLTRHC